MIHTVSSSAELEAVFRAVSAGDRIELLAGNYGAVRLKNRDFDTPVTITSANPSNPATFRDALTITGTRGVEISGLNFAPDNGALGILDLVLISDSSDMTLRENAFTGYLPGPGEGLARSEDIDSSAKAKGLIEGVPFARGIRVTSSEHVALEANTFTQLRKGIILDTVQNVSIEHNHLHDLRSDGVNLVDAVSVVIAGNLMESFHPLHNYDNIAYADHGDFIQWWAGDGGLGIRDLTIRDNALLQGTGSWVQGIFGRSGMANADGSPAEFSNIVIENNLINTSHTNGIFVGDARDVQIVGNTLLPAPQDLTQPVVTSGVPTIHVRTSGTLLPDGSYDFSNEGALPQDVSVRNNVVVGDAAFGSYQIDTSLHAGLRISAADNLVLSENAADPGWWGQIYPELVSDTLTSLEQLDTPSEGSLGFKAATVSEALLSRFEDTDRQVSAVQFGTKDDDNLLADGSGRVVDADDGQDLIRGTANPDVLRGGKGSDQILSGDGADLIAFHRSDLARGDLDAIIDLDFAAGDWISFSDGFGVGFFDDSTHASNALTTFGSGDSAIIHDLADLAEIVALDAVSAQTSLSGAIDVTFDFDEDGSGDWTLRLFGVSGVGESPLAPGEAASASQGTTNSDVLRGAETDDQIFGGAGNDLLDGRSGADEMHGGDGDDRFYIDDTGDTAIEYIGQGYDRVYASVDYILPNAIEALAARGSNSIRLTGNAGDNWITSNEGSDALRGGAGQDRLISRDGRDWLDGGSGDDILQGGNGDDRYVVDSGRDQVLERASEGYDRVYTTVDFKLGTEVEALDARGVLNIALTGNEAGNWITGNSGDNRLSGEGGNDRLIGRDGDDVLDGGAGSDILEGGAGRDVFAFEAGDGADVITDFDSGTDLLLIDAVAASGSISAVEIVSGVILFLENSGDRIVLQGMTEVQVMSDQMFVTGQDWSIEF
ncbi:MAG: right-handed parallel beta-helix repeat-containing protein [Pseudomonadota bacterium]